MDCIQITSGDATKNATNIIPCTHIADPSETALVKRENGLDEAVQDYVKFDRGYRIVLELVEILLGRGVTELNFRCTAGLFRSVAVAELVSRELANRGVASSVEHLSLNVVE